MTDLDEITYIEFDLGDIVISQHNEGRGTADCIRLSYPAYQRLKSIVEQQLRTQDEASDLPKEG